VLLNAAPPIGALLIADAVEAVKIRGLVPAPVILSQRAAYVHATTIGLGVSEYEPGGKAASEIAALWGWIATTQLKEMSHAKTAKPRSRKSA
jgi:chromosome partitioning protein